MDEKFPPYRTGICSGWMNIRGARKACSRCRICTVDHADWEGLISGLTEAESLPHPWKMQFWQVLGNEKIMAVELETLFEGENGSLTEE